jgi:ribosomal protein S18 acetylase RimI-like enzyme
MSYAMKMTFLADSKPKIRLAMAGDESGLARVHIQSWQESYQGLLPQDYLDQLPTELEERIENWKRTLKNPQRWTFVAENSTGIVCFILFGPPRDANKESFIELGAIYLLSAEKAKGIGFSLLSAGFNLMKDLGYKRAYCWVLENNPTIKFYERSGAGFSGEIKQDEIGGKKFNELAYEWDCLKLGELNWKPISVDEVKILFKDFKLKWWIAGGWAIDLYLKKQTRKHGDVDILVQREDQRQIQVLLQDWELWVSDPPGNLRPWRKGEFLQKGIQDIWARKTAKDPWQLQIMFFDTENNEWIYKRDETIRRGLSLITVVTDEGLFLLAPEVQLLYKSKSLREKDKLDFENTRLAMNPAQKDWLREMLIKIYNNHEWINKL